MNRIATLNPVLIARQTVSAPDDASPHHPIAVLMPSKGKYPFRQHHRRGQYRYHYRHCGIAVFPIAGIETVESLHAHITKSAHRTVRLVRSGRVQTVNILWQTILMGPTRPDNRAVIAATAGACDRDDYQGFM